MDQTPAESILSKAWQAPVRLDAGEPLDERTHVRRHRVANGPTSSPSTVIVKSVRDVESSPLFFNEWAALKLLDELDCEVAPAFYGGDVESGIIVMGDLGQGSSLADLLLGNDREQAETGLLAYASGLGRFHAATIGKQTRFDEILLGLGQPPASVPDRTAMLEQGLFRTLETLGIAQTPALQQEVARVLADWRAPGPFLALTHGDPCPDNNRIVAGQFKLFDFEGGQFRHALTDGVYGRIHFPTCWCVNRLPDPLPAQMEAAYRAELARGCPQAADDAIFYPAMIEMCAAWLMTMCALPGRSILDFLETDRNWGISSIRQRILLRSELLASLTTEFGHFEALGNVFGDLAHLLRQRWDWQDESMPLYPVFRS